MAPELKVPEQPLHVDVEALVASEDWCSDVVGVGGDLCIMETELIIVVPIVDAEELRSEKALDGVQERGRIGVNLSLSDVKTGDLKKVGLVDQILDVLQVLGVVSDITCVLLVAERVYFVLVTCYYLSRLVSGERS